MSVDIYIYMCVCACTHQKPVAGVHGDAGQLKSRALLVFGVPVPSVEQAGALKPGRGLACHVVIRGCEREKGVWGTGIVGCA